MNVTQWTHFWNNYRVCLRLRERMQLPYYTYVTYQMENWVGFLVREEGTGLKSDSNFQQSIICGDKLDNCSIGFNSN